MTTDVRQMNSLPHIEAFNKEWIGTESHKAFAKWYTQQGMQMNVTGICHDHLCAGIWRAIEKWQSEERQKALTDSIKHTQFLMI